MRPKDQIILTGKTKVCTACKEAKDEGFFYANNPRCKDCVRGFKTSGDGPGRKKKVDKVVGTLKTCKTCGVKKDLSEFYFRKDNNAYRASCKQCVLDKIRVPVVTEADRLRVLRKSAKARGILICASCNLSKEKEDFYNERDQRCKDCQKKRASEYNRRVKSKWTAEEYEKAYEEQAGICYSCGEYHDKLVGDHCHKTNKPRRLLCNRCNLIIGMAKEDPEILRNAASYCEEYALEKTE